jgi:hypothetical protein
MSPETFQVVVGTGACQENVNDEVAVVLENPLGVFVAFDADRKLALLLQFQVNFIADGLILPRAAAGTDQEVVGKSGDFLKIEDDNLLRFLGLRRSSCCKPISFKDFYRSVLLAVTERLLVWTDKE